MQKRTSQLYSTAYNNSFHVPDLRVAFCMCIIVLSYAANNLVVRGAQTPFIARVRRSYCPRTTYDTIISLLIGSNHENGHVVCLKVNFPLGYIYYNSRMPGGTFAGASFYYGTPAHVRASTVSVYSGTRHRRLGLGSETCG